MAMIRTALVQVVVHGLMQVCIKASPSPFLPGVGELKLPHAFTDERRLADVMSDECKAACPKVSAWATATQAMQMQFFSSTNGGGNMTDALQSQMIKKSNDLNCQHVDAMKCIVKNQDVCGESSPLGTHPECMCTACPCYFDMLSVGPNSSEESGMKQTCKMIPYYLCMIEAPECDGMMSRSDDGDGGEPVTKEQIKAVYEAQKSQCGADLGPECVPGGASETSKSGSMSMQTCGSVKSAYKAAGCCGNPSKDFTMGDMNLRRLSEDELLESVKAALQKQKVERGSSSSLLKAIDAVVKRYIEAA